MPCDPTSDLESSIAEAAKRPAKVTGDAGSVELQKLSDLIAADRYLAEKCAAGNPARRLRFNKLVPPGAD